MAYPAGAPLPSSSITQIILDGDMSDGIVPEYLENKSLSKSFVKIISLLLEKFSTVENFIKVKNNKIFTIGNICIETINCTPNIAGVRTVKIESDFKNIFSIFLTGYITEGQNAEHLMRQVVHDYYSKIVATKQVRLYAAGNQSIELTIIGTI